MPIQWRSFPAHLQRFCSLVHLLVCEIDVNCHSQLPERIMATPRARHGKKESPERVMGLQFKTSSSLKVPDLMATRPERVMGYAGDLL